MPFLTALALDRLNEALVRWRLAGRLPPHAGEPVGEYLRALGAGIHPDPAHIEGFEPRETVPDRWQADAPWRSARGANARWYAEVHGTTPARPAAPALILLHGWLIDRPQLVIYRRWARRAAARGLEVWMPRLPHHMERAEPDEISGQRCLSPDLGTSLDAVRQAVLEARLLARWLRRRGAPRVGIWGMSLGGWVAALAATLDDDWDAVALWAPVASPVEVLFESNLVELLRAAIEEGGATREEFAAAEMASMTPARLRGRVSRARVLIVAGAYDQVVSARSVARLARRWDVDVHWVPHGHISLMASRAPVEQTTAFLAGALG